MDGSDIRNLPFQFRRMSSLCSQTPPIFICALNTNLVLESIGKVAVNSKLQMAPQKKSDNKNQQWIWEESGHFDDLSYYSPLNAQAQGSQVIIAERKDDVHNWHQQWEFHKGYIRSMSNHNLVLDVQYRNVQPGASLCVFRPHKRGNHTHQQWGLKLYLNATDSKPYILPVRTPVQDASKFDPSKLEPRLLKFWSLNATFGKQSSPEDVFFNEIVSNRYCLINGVQLIKDELQLAFEKGANVMACAADLSLPSTITTLAYTNCGDRINHSFHRTYNAVVGSRFASLSARGDLMTENFSPAGGGTDDGGVLAHVTVSHQLDDTIKKKMYEGNKSSYVLVNIDLMTHVGCDLSDSGIQFGTGSESGFREPRSACGAIIATLTRYSDNNVVHNRIRRNLGEKNYEILKQKIVLPDGTDITCVVAAAIVAIKGVHDTCQAMTNELDQRGVAHVTASTTVNTTINEDHIFYLLRATVFGGKIKYQGFGLDASLYSGVVENHYGRKRLVLLYDGKRGDQMDIEVIQYTVKELSDGH